MLDFQVGFSVIICVINSVLLKYGITCNNFFLTYPVFSCKQRRHGQSDGVLRFRADIARRNCYEMFNA